MATLGDRVKQKRISLGWSQAELAARVSKILRRKVSQVAIHHIESRGNVSPRFVVELAHVLGVSLSWLQHGREDQPPAAGKDAPAGFIGHSSEPSQALLDMLMEQIYQMPEGSAEEKAVLTIMRHLKKQPKP